VTKKAPTRGRAGPELQFVEPAPTAEVAQPIWDTSCLDWKERILAGTSLVPDLPLFEAEAERAVKIFDSLRIPDVSGRPFMRDAVLDWVRSIVRALFGAYDRAAKVRYIQELFLLVPKKNGKTSFAAAIMMVAILMNDRPLAELLLISSTISVAQIAFKQAKGIILADPVLTAKFLIQDHIRLITYRPTGAVLSIKAADTDTITGGKQTFILIDELHVLSSKSRADEVILELRGALAARPDGFLIIITTQSKDTPAGVFKAELETARAVRDGQLKRPLLPVLYELPEELGADAWRDEKYWRIVNPNLGLSVSPQFLRDELAKNERTGPEALALLASQHFNVEIGLRLRADRWRAAEYWEAATDKSVNDLAALLARSEVAVVGIDGGGMDDLLALCVTGREKGTRNRLMWFHAWAHKGVLDIRQEIAPRLRDFQKAGELTIYSELGEDIDEVVDIVEQVKESGLLPDKHAIGVDQAGIGEIPDALMDPEGLGLTLDHIVGVPQGWKLWGVIQSLERRLASRTSLHGGQALAAWAVSNAKLEPRGNAMVMTKSAAGRAKIDPVIAALNAESLMDRNPNAKEASVYAKREMIFL
jgi:phage terminase large subunit-like protein